MTGVWVFGGAPSDFARTFTREGLDNGDIAPDGRLPVNPGGGLIGGGHLVGARSW